MDVFRCIFRVNMNVVFFVEMFVFVVKFEENMIWVFYKSVI